MKIFSIVILSLFITSCSIPFPKDPEIKEFYVVLFDKSNKPVCTKYDLISYAPFKITNPKYLDISQCNAMGGFKPDDIQKLINYSMEVKEWAQSKTSCN